MDDYGDNMTPNESRALALIAERVPGARTKIIRADMNGQDAVALFPMIRNISNSNLRQLERSESVLGLWANA